MSSESVSPAAKLAELESQLSDLTTISPVGLFMLYGKQGVGKSVLAVRVAQAITPPDKKIVLIDYSHNWTSLLNHPPELRERVKRIQYDGYSQLETLAKVVTAGAGSFGDVGCFIFDEHTSMAETDLDLITRQRAKTDPEKDPDTPLWPDMRPAIVRSRRVMGMLIGAGIHNIYVCHEREDGPVASPSYLPKQIPKMSEPLHFVGRLTATITEGGDNAGKYTRQVQCHPSRRVTAKCRIGSAKVFESHESLIRKMKEWLDSGGVPDEEAKQVVLANEIKVAMTDNPEDEIDPAIVTE